MANALPVNASTGKVESTPNGKHAGKQTATKPVKIEKQDDLEQSHESGEDVDMKPVKKESFTKVLDP